MRLKEELAMRHFIYGTQFLVMSKLSNIQNLENHYLIRIGYVRRSIEELYSFL